MVSPFRRHQMQTRSLLAAAAAGAALAADAAPAMPEDGPAAAEYRQQLARLHEDLRTLHGIQSKEAKAERKVAMIESYRPWLEGALAIEAAAPQDDIVITCMIWAVDIRDWELADKLVNHVIAHNLQMPEQFRRTAAGYMVSEIAKLAVDQPGSVPHEVLERIAPLAEPPHDMKDETRALLQRALGESWARRADDFDPNADTATAGGKPALIDAALAHMRRAFALHDKVGVKRPIELLEREAKRLAEAAAEKQD